MFLIILGRKLFVEGLFVDQAEESSVGEDEDNYRQYCPEESEIFKCFDESSLPKERINDGEVYEPVVEIRTYKMVRV